MNVAGGPQLFPDNVAMMINDLLVNRPTIRRMITVCQLDDGSISYSRAARVPEEDEVLSFIGMLDFAKMGFFQGLQSADGFEPPVDDNGLEDTSWIEGDA